MKNLITRAVSGFVYVCLIIGAIFAGNEFFIPFTTLLTVLGIYEFSKVVHIKDFRKHTLANIIDYVAGALITLSPLLLICYMPGVLLLTLVSLMGIYILCRFSIALTDKGDHAYADVAKSVLAVVYISVPVFMLNLLYIDGGAQTQMLVLLMFVMIWLNDTGAYCVGTMLGKHRLCERLSPKKSWEGFWGGMVFCVIGGIVSYLWFNSVQYSLVGWLVYSVFVSLMSTLGDLFESMLKRTMHVKDSGHIMPGHGGILDRIDSLLFVAPASLIVYSISLLL